MNNNLYKVINDLVCRYADDYGLDIYDLPDDIDFDEDFDCFINEEIQLDHMNGDDTILIDAIKDAVLEEITHRHETNSI